MAGHGGTDQTVLAIAKAITETTLQPKKVEGHDKKNFRRIVPDVRSPL